MQDIICPKCGARNTVREHDIHVSNLVMDDEGKIIIAGEPGIDDRFTRWECSACLQTVRSDKVRGDGQTTGWIIRKRSRSGTSPYNGPITTNLNIEPRVYFDKEEVLRVASKLGEHNPVGFSVVRVRLVEVEE